MRAMQRKNLNGRNLTLMLLVFALLLAQGCGGGGGGGSSSGGGDNGGGGNGGGGDVAIPTAPTQLTATVISSSRVDLSWSASTDDVAVTSYNITRNGALIAAASFAAQTVSGNVTRYVDTGLNQNTRYCYRVRAYDADGHYSELSAESCVTTFAAETPTNVDNDGDGYTELQGDCDDADTTLLPTTLWRNDADGDGYSPGGTLTQCLRPTGYTLPENLTGTEPDCNDQNAAYHPHANDVCGDGIDQDCSGSDTQCAADTQTPSTPADLAAVAETSFRVHLSWSASTDNIAVSAYKIYRNDALASTSTTNQHYDTGLVAQTAYCYRVSAIDAAGNESPQSEQVCATTLATSVSNPPTAPTSLSSTVMSASRIDLTWGASTDDVAVMGYNVYRYGQLLAQGLSGQTVGAGVTSYSDTGLRAATLYCYNVAAYDASGNVSALSNQSCATTQAAITPENSDDDGDGYTEQAGDCNDSNADISPATVWQHDADNDGYASGETLTQCQRPDGYKLLTELVGSLSAIDCADSNASINPGATDVCEDGIDQNCSGEDTSCFAGFADSALETCVRDVLAKPTGTITDADLRILSALQCQNKGISQLGGIESMVELKSVDFETNQIQSAGPLFSLTGLTTLRLGDNNLTSLAGFGVFGSLTELDVSANQLTSISQVSGLTSLESLLVDDNQITDISPVAGLSRLTVLQIANNNISDLAPVSGLSKLIALFAESNRISNVSPLGGMTELIILGLDDNCIVDFTPVMSVPAVSGQSNQRTSCQ